MSIFSSIFSKIFDLIRNILNATLGKIINIEGGLPVNMNLIEILIYSLVPMLGQFLLRADKLGGSLDKIWLLFPLFLIPPFSFIPVLMAKLGWIKGTNAGKPYDIYMIIPIISRLIIVFALQYFNNTNMALKVGLILASLLITNILHINNEPRCKNVKKDAGGQIVKASFDSLALYASGVLGTFLITFIPVVGEIFQGLATVGGPLADIADTLVWGFGIAAGYIFINMFDGTYETPEQACSGKTPQIRMIVSIIAFVAALAYQMFGSFV
jgi:hypothetical protein